MPYDNWEEKNMGEVYGMRPFRGVQALRAALAQAGGEKLYTDAGRDQAASTIKGILEAESVIQEDQRCPLAVIDIHLSNIVGYLEAALSSAQYKSRGFWNTDRTNDVQNTGTNKSGKTDQKAGEDGTAVSGETKEQMTAIDWTKEDSAVNGVSKNLARAMAAISATGLGYYKRSEIESKDGLKWTEPGKKTGSG